MMISLFTAFLFEPMLTLHKLVLINCLVLLTCVTQAPEGSTMPKMKKHARGKNSAAATSRITRSRATTTTESVEATNHQEHSAPNPTNTSPHLTSKDSNSPDADSGVQGSQDMIGTSGQSDNMITLQGQGICDIIASPLLFST